MTQSTRRTKSELQQLAIAALAQRWPGCFALRCDRRRPLKIGIHHDILAAFGGRLDVRDLGAVLRRYTSAPTYLYRSVAGANRVDLNGRHVGVVTADEAAKAAAKLSAYCAKRNNKIAAAKRNNNKSAIQKRVFERPTSTGGRAERGQRLREHARQMESPARLGQRAGLKLMKGNLDEHRKYNGGDSASTFS